MPDTAPPEGSVLRRSLTAQTAGGLSLLDAVAWCEGGMRQFRLFFAAGTRAGTVAPGDPCIRERREVAGGVLVLGADGRPDGSPVALTGPDGAVEVRVSAPEWEIFAGRNAIDRAFLARGLKPEIALSALDSDVIKSYVSLGLGVGIISSRAYREGKEEGLAALDCSHLLPEQTTRLAYKRGGYLRGYTVEFIRLLAPNVRAEDLRRLEGAAAQNFSI